MAIFGIGKNKKEDQKEAAAAPAKAKKAAAKKASPKKKTPSAASSAKAAAAPAVKTAVSGVSSAAAEVILRPHITEKSGLLSQSNVYTFQVTSSATKQAVAQAVKALYKVTPAKVAVINLPAKQVFVRGRWGTVAGVRKAMVTLKEGDKIDFV